MVTPVWDIPDDGVLGPVLARLSCDAVLDACRAQLTRVAGAVREGWQHARVIEALYHPGRYVRVAYSLLRDPDTPASRVWPQGQIVYVHAPVRKPMSRRGTVLTVDGVEMEVYRFPNDRRLRGLRKFAGSDTAAAVWQGWIDKADGAYRLDAETLQRLLIRYVPEQKWVVRLRCVGRHRDTDALRKRRIAVRSASPESCATLLYRHTVLHGLSRHADAKFFVPTVVGEDVASGLLAVKWVHGIALVEALAARPVSEVMGGVAGMLASFHGSNVVGLPAVGVDDVVARVEAAASDLAAACPALAGDAVALVDDLLGRCGALRPCPEAVTLHNDLHWNQVRIEDERFAVLDLERMAIGDALIDVGNLWAQLRLLSQRDDQTVDAATALSWSSAWLDAWARVTGRPVDRVRLGWYSALSALELARGMMRHLRPGWRRLAAQCVAFARAQAASADVGLPA